MTKFSGQQRWAIGEGGRPYLELPADREPLPEPHETEWDRLARDVQRKRRVEFQRTLLDNRLIRPVPSPLR